MVRCSWLLLALAACPSAKQEARESCDALLACASVVNPFLVRDFDAAYGDEGVCWETSADPEACAQACEDGLIGLWIQYDHAESCDPSAFREPGSLTVEQFLEEFENRFCDAVEACDPDRSCSGYYNAFGSADDCEDYDPDAADVCLEEEMACEESYPGFSYPIIPTVCESVCD